MDEIISPHSSASEQDLGTRLEQHLDLLRQGIVAARANDKVRARSLFRQAIAIQNKQEVTWLWLASVAVSYSEVRTCMEQVLRINPENQRAGDWLRKAGALATPGPSAESTQAPLSTPATEREARASTDEATAGPARSTPKRRRPETQPIPSDWREAEARSTEEEPTEAEPAEVQPADGRPAATGKTPSAFDTAELERPKVIMAVDDSPTVRKLVAVTLERQGYRVVSVADGMQALAKLQDVIPDLILLDIAMPHLDGYQICKVIKANDLTCDVPVVMLSGKDGFFDKVRGRMAGAVDYVTKPFEPQALLRILEKNLRDRDG